MESSLQQEIVQALQEEPKVGTTIQLVVIEEERETEILVELKEVNQNPFDSAVFAIKGYVPSRKKSLSGYVDLREESGHGWIGFDD